MKNVMISAELFGKIIKYHLLDQKREAEDIRKGLEKKLDTMANRELYSKYKTAPTEEEREKSRQEYLDRKGIPESFRW
ncbi:complexin-2 [Eubacterium ramulus]|uniref:complexin-2 n=1 Tax=Eubacterium ramulus TaxID=39490 RepID=UPI002FD8067B